MEQTLTYKSCIKTIDEFIINLHKSKDDKCELCNEVILMENDNDILNHYYQKHAKKLYKMLKILVLTREYWSID